MGASISAEVFKPPTPPKYDRTKEGLLFVPSSDGERQIPIVCYQGAKEPTPTSPVPPSLEENEQADQSEADKKQEEDRDDKNKKVPWHILYCKGGTEDIGMMDKWLRIMAFTLHCNVWSFDYCGFGINEGLPSEKACYEDTFCVFKYLTEEKKIPSHRIVAYGRSVGSAPALRIGDLLSEKAKTSLWLLKGSKSRTASSPSDVQRLGGIILQSPILSVISCVSDSPNTRQNSRLATLSSSDIFDNAKIASHITCPVKIIHGEKDDIVPIKQSHRLRKRLTNAQPLYDVLVVPDATHYDLEVGYSDDLLDALIDFFECCEGKSKSDPLRSKDHPKIQKEIPSTYGGPGVAAFLKSVGLSQYEKNILGFGYMELEHMQDVPLEELELMGITDAEHRNVIFQHIQQHFSTASKPEGSSSTPPPPTTELSIKVEASKEKGPAKSFTEDNIAQLTRSATFSKFQNTKVTGSFQGEPRPNFKNRSSLDPRAAQELSVNMRMAEENMRLSFMNDALLDLAILEGDRGVGSEPRKEYIQDLPLRSDRLWSPQEVVEKKYLQLSGGLNRLERNRSHGASLNPSLNSQITHSATDRFGSPQRFDSPSKGFNSPTPLSPSQSPTLAVFGTARPRAGTSNQPKKKTKMRNIFRSQASSSSINLDSLYLAPSTITPFPEGAVFLGIGIGYGDLQIVSVSGKQCLLSTTVLSPKSKSWKLFKRSLVSICQLDTHAHVLSNFGLYGSPNDSPAIISEPADGVLEPLLQSGKVIALWERMLMCYHLASGLAFLHRNGIIHGNLGLHTVAFCRVDEAEAALYPQPPSSSETAPSLPVPRLEGKEIICKVSGYGLTQKVSIDLMSPEMLVATSQGSSSVEASPSMAGDVWNLGSLIFYLLHLRSPFLDGSEKFYAATQGYRPSMDNCPLGWKEVLSLCWETDPTQRKSACHIANEVESLVRYWASRTQENRSDFEEQDRKASVEQDRDTGKKTVKDGDEEDTEEEGFSDSPELGQVPLGRSFTGWKGVMRSNRKKQCSKASFFSENGIGSGVRNLTPHTPIGREQGEGAGIKGDFLAMVNSSFLHDIIFVIGPSKEHFFAHKFVLAARSPQFRSDLQSSLGESSVSLLRIELPEVKETSILPFLKFVYGGQLPNPETNAQIGDLYYLAKKFDLYELSSFLEMREKEKES